MSNENSDDNNEFEVVYSYGIEQAIEDGVLIRPDENVHALIITPNVHDAIEEAMEKDGRNYKQVLVPLVLDAQMAFNAALEKDKEEWMVVLEGTVAGKVFVCLNELGGLTIMTPSEY